MNLMAWIQNAQELPGKIGKDLEELGGVLRCMKCGYEQPLEEGDCAHYLTHGWKKHCGQTMRWVTARDLRYERGEKDG